MTGMTLHQVTPDLDGGRIVHQKGASLRRGDGLHMLAARTTRDFFDEVIPLISSCVDKSCFPAGLPQKRKGKIWLKSDWRPEHLRLIYGLFNDKIVDEYLSRKLPNTEPTLISVFKWEWNHSCVNQSPPASQITNATGEHWLLPKQYPPKHLVLWNKTIWKLLDSFKQEWTQNAYRAKRWLTCAASR